MKASDLILVNAQGKVVDGGPVRLLNTAAYMIHHAIHEARPDVLCAAHSHTIYGRSFCSLGRKLDTITQDSCAFHNDHVVYESFNGVVLAEEEGKNIAKALGSAKAALLQNHGPLTVGGTIEEAVFWFVSLDKCCQAQLLADAAAGGRGGSTIKIDEEDAVYTYKTVGTPKAGMFDQYAVDSWCTNSFFRMVLSEADVRCYSQGDWRRLPRVSLASQRPRLELVSFEGVWVFQGVECTVRGPCTLQYNFEHHCILHE